MFITVSIMLNVTGFWINVTLGLPLFLDSIGTILAAVILGPWLGALTGFLSNLISGIVANPVNIPFGLTNAAIGLIVGYLSRKRGFTDFLTPLYAALILTFACPILATPIAVYLFGGATGGKIDTFFALMIESGHHIYSSAFLVRLPANFADKLISAYLVMLLIRFFPDAWKTKNYKQNLSKDKAASS